MKKIIETVAEGGGELGVHMYPFMVITCSMSASVCNIKQFWLILMKILWICPNDLYPVLRCYRAKDFMFFLYINMFVKQDVSRSIKSLKLSFKCYKYQISVDTLKYSCSGRMGETLYALLADRCL